MQVLAPCTYSCPHPFNSALSPRYPAVKFERAFTIAQTRKRQKFSDQVSSSSSLPPETTHGMLQQIGISSSKQSNRIFLIVNSPTILCLGCLAMLSATPMFVSKKCDYWHNFIPYLIPSLSSIYIINRTVVVYTPQLNGTRDLCQKCRPVSRLIPSASQAASSALR